MFFISQIFKCLFQKVGLYNYYEYREIERVNSNETFVVYLSDDED